MVDDASHDDTVAVARRLGLRTIVHERNRGYGGNQKTCYRAALGTEADVVVMLHPDYQYSPKLLTAMSSLVAIDHYDVVLGSRILSGGALAGGMPLYKYISNRVLTATENVLTWRQAERVPHGVSSLLSQGPRAFASRREQRRLRVRRRDARSVYLLRIPHRRGELPHSIRTRLVLHQLPAQRRLRHGRSARDSRTGSCQARDRPAGHLFGQGPAAHGRGGGAFGHPAPILESASLSSCLPVRSPRSGRGSSPPRRVREYRENSSSCRTLAWPSRRRRRDSQMPSRGSVCSSRFTQPRSRAAAWVWRLPGKSSTPRGPDRRWRESARTRGRDSAYRLPRNEPWRRTLAHRLCRRRSRRTRVPNGASAAAGP